jgi:hypothetical protein
MWRSTRRASEDLVLERAAIDMLIDALAQATALHLPGARDHHRRRLEHAIDHATRVLAAADEATASASVIASARSTLVKAHAARAEDARHGAGQLSLGAQRAPTSDACDDGWLRVEAIVTVAEASALAAARMAAVLDDSATWKAARGGRSRRARRTPHRRRAKPRLYVPYRPGLLIW